MTAAHRTMLAMVTVLALVNAAMSHWVVAVSLALVVASTMTFYNIRSGK